MSWDPVPGRLILKPRHKGTSGLPSLHHKKVNIQKEKLKTVMDLSSVDLYIE